MATRWMMWLEQHGRRIIGQGAASESQARALADELAGMTRRLEPGGHDCLLYKNGQLFDHWIGYKGEACG